MGKENFLRISAAILAFALLSACNGNNGSGVDPAATPSQDPPAEETPTATAFPVSATIDYTDNIVAIGPGWKYQSPTIDDLETNSSYGAIEVRSGRWRDPKGRDGSASAADVVRFLKAFQTQAHREDGPGARLATVDFGVQKTLRIESSALSSERELVVAALRNINTALPWEHRILLGPDISEQLATEDIPAGEIHIHFTSGTSSWPETEGGYSPRVLGIGGVNYGAVNGDTEAHTTVLSGYVYIDRSRVSPAQASMEFVITHEILHAYGVGAHVDPNQYPDSILVPELDDPDQVPKVFLTLDGEALLAEIRIGHGTLLSELTPEDLGPWSDTGFHLLGWSDLGGQNEQKMQFGAGYRNGFGKPWAYGPVPEIRIQDNPELSETATWAGSLLGFSRAGRTVAGAAEIGLDFRRFDGRADFTGLESWASGIHPGAPGSGQLWGDGDLGYSVSIEQDGTHASIYSTFAPGDDPGIVTGALVGAAHEGAAGVLEHPDLSAAFGAVR